MECRADAEQDQISLFYSRGFIQPWAAGAESARKATSALRPRNCGFFKSRTAHEAAKMPRTIHNGLFGLVYAASAATSKGLGSNRLIATVLRGCDQLLDLGFVERDSSHPRSCSAAIQPWGAILGAHRSRPGILDRYVALQQRFSEVLAGRYPILLEREVEASRKVRRLPASPTRPGGRINLLLKLSL